MINIKVIHEMKKTAKNGAMYREIWAVIMIDGVEFIRKFVVF